MDGAWQRHGRRQRPAWRMGQGELGEELSVYGLSDEDLALQARAVTFADELIPFEVEAEMSGGELPADVVAGHAKRARELGLASTNMPRELGGGGCSTLQQVLVQEQAAARCSRSWSRSRWAG